MKKIGFIGLGNMGAKMVANLLATNYEVTGYDINEKLVDELLPNGVKKASNLGEISRDSEIIITMLPNGDIVENVYESLINNSKPGTLFTDCSTIDVDKAKDLHKKCQNRGLLSLDAPVSGGVGGAENGTLTFMVGGEEKAYKIMLPVFEVMGKNHSYVDRQVQDKQQKHVIICY